MLFRRSQTAVAEQAQTRLATRGHWTLSPGYQNQVKLTVQGGGGGGGVLLYLHHWQPCNITSTNSWADCLKACRVLLNMVQQGSDTFAGELVSGQLCTKAVPDINFVDARPLDSLFLLHE
jgi:hypothetical protein